MPRVHRFHDDVAVSIGTGPTVYLTAAEAKALAHALLDYAWDAATSPFLESTLRGWQSDGGSDEPQGQHPDRPF